MSRIAVATESLWSRAARPSLFWFALLAVGAVALPGLHEPELSDLGGFFLLVVTAMLPAFLWCHRFVGGIPIFPLFTASTVWTFALPLISQHPLIRDYPPHERLLAALTVAATSVCGTVPWYFLARRLPSRRGAYFGFHPAFGEPLFFAILLGATLFNLAQGRLVQTLDPGVVSIFRAMVIALSNLAIFVLAYRLGRRDLPRARRVICLALVGLVALSTLPSALMVGALSYAVMALIGATLGAGRVPWISLGLITAAAFFLQGGKEALRDKYWYGADAQPISITESPAFVIDWLRFSWLHLSDDSPGAQVVPEIAPESLAERASLLQLFLRIQQMSPAEVPYLHGATYRIIPRLLVPRLFNAEKERAHLGTYLLALHYRVQTEEDTLTTTIGFGLINEAMANFGYAGCVGLGALLGVFYGAVARWSAGYPLLSARVFFAVLVLSVSFQDEFTAGIYVSTLFQGTCTLLLLSLGTMTRISPRPVRPSIVPRAHLLPA